MNKYKYPLSVSTWGVEELKAIEKVTKSGNFTMGEEVEKFENMFSKYIGSKYSLMVNSGSSANLLMIASLFFRKEKKISINDEVIVPALGWSTSYFPLSQYGLKLKFVDIDVNTLNYNLESLEKAISKKTKVILAINILGNPNDFGQIEQIIKGKEIILLEDNCESLGAEYNQRKAGSFGLIGTYSTFFSHHISTMEGGMITTNDDEIYQIMLCLRAHGWTRNLPKDNYLTGTKSKNEFEEFFKFILPGYNVRPLEMSGAIGQEQLIKLPDFISTRRKNGLLLQRMMNDHPHLSIQKEIGNSSWFGFSLTIKNPNKLNRGLLQKQLIQNGFQVRPVVTGNFTKQPVMKFLNADISNSLSNANYIHENSLFIGNHHYEMEEAIVKISKISI